MIMNKKFLGSTFIGVFILLCVGFVLGAYTLDAPDTHDVVAGTNISVIAHGDGDGAFIHNITLFYGVVAGAETAWYKAQLMAAGGNSTGCVSLSCMNTTANQTGWHVFWNTTGNLTDTTDKGLGLSLLAMFEFMNSTKYNTSTLTNVSLDNTAPTLALENVTTDDFALYDSNENTLYFKTGVLAFNYTVTDPHIANCTLYHNLTGTWSINETDVLAADAENGTSIAWARLANPYPDGGRYVWGVKCVDTAVTINPGLTLSDKTPNKVESANITFYVDIEIPTFNKDYLFDGVKKSSAIWVEDSDPNDDSTVGTKLLSGIYTTELGETLTIHCDVTDSGSAGASYLESVKYFIKKPGMNIFKEFSSTTCPIGVTESDKTKCKLDSSDIFMTGTYYVYCRATDKARHTDVSSSEKDAFRFLVQAEEEGEVTGTYVKAFNVDFSKTTEKTIAEPEGRVLTVTFDGVTEHTITFDKVSATSVTLTISSDPITITLKRGGTEKIDINNDGIYDFSVTYKDYILGNAQLEFKALEGAEAVAREESPTPTTIAVTPPTQPKMGIGIWIVLGVVAIGLVVYFVLVKRKKK